MYLETDFRRIGRHYKLEGNMAQENREGRPCLLQERDEEQSEHIKKYKCHALHYLQNKIIRSYLSPELNLKKKCL